MQNMAPDRDFNIVRKILRLFGLVLFCFAQSAILVHFTSEWKTCCLPVSWGVVMMMMLVLSRASSWQSLTVWPHVTALWKLNWHYLSLLCTKLHLHSYLENGMILRLPALPYSSFSWSCIWVVLHFQSPPYFDLHTNLGHITWSWKSLWSFTGVQNPIITNDEQEIWANAHETRHSISIISYAGCLVDLQQFRRKFTRSVYAVA